jgi:hypothetical protein
VEADFDLDALDDDFTPTPDPAAPATPGGPPRMPTPDEMVEWICARLCEIPGVRERAEAARDGDYARLCGIYHRMRAIEGLPPIPPAAAIAGMVRLAVAQGRESGQSDAEIYHDLLGRVHDGCAEDALRGRGSVLPPRAEFMATAKAALAGCLGPIGPGQVDGGDGS